MWTQADKVLDHAWHVVNVETGAESGEQSDERLLATGAERLFLYLATLWQVREGRLSLDARLPYTAAIREAAAHGVLRSLDAPKVFALRDVMAQMLIIADDAGMFMTCDAIGAAGIDALALVRDWVGQSGLQGTEVLPPDAGIPSGAPFRLASTPRDLAHLALALGATAAGGGSALQLGLDSALAKEALRVMSALSGKDGLSGYLPNWGPFSTKSPHLLVDEGPARRRQRRNWVDLALVHREDQPLFAAAIFCKDVPAVVNAKPGVYVAAKEMAVVGRGLWDAA